jgi:hypothetical protein
MQERRYITFDTYVLAWSLIKEWVRSALGQEELANDDEILVQSMRRVLDSPYEHPIQKAEKLEALFKRAEWSGGETGSVKQR